VTSEPDVYNGDNSLPDHLAEMFRNVHDDLNKANVRNFKAYIARYHEHPQYKKEVAAVQRALAVAERAPSYENKKTSEGRAWWDEFERAKEDMSNAGVNRSDVFPLRKLLEG